MILALVAVLSEVHQTVTLSAHEAEAELLPRVLRLQELQPGQPTVSVTQPAGIGNKHHAYLLVDPSL